jgi:hypothetical protein
LLFIFVFNGLHDADFPIHPGGIYPGVSAEFLIGYCPEGFQVLQSGFLENKQSQGKSFS